MKPATFAPAYVGLFPILSDVARSRGYALAAHGSLVTDFDLVAIPWTDKAVSSEQLIRAIAERIGFTRDSTISIDRLFEAPYTEDKPHGRQSWAIPLDSGAVLDISVTPRLSCNPFRFITLSDPCEVCSGLGGHWDGEVPDQWYGCPTCNGTGKSIIVES